MITPYKCFLSLLTPLLLIYGCSTEQLKETAGPPEDGPIRLHPDNPHYFLYRGKALALITSAEHYGALINLDFDYQTYLNTLASEGMNYTRVFAGSYFEIPGESFGIQNNTLAPETGRVITPWMQVDSDPGTPKYDLSTWNPRYFNRLADFMKLAQSLDIMVEFTFFSSIYRDEHWAINPQNPENNINIENTVDRKQAHTLNNGELLKYQEALVIKLIRELNDFDNFFFEIQNEPWADRGVPVYNIINKDRLETGDWTFKSDFADEESIAWHDHLIELIATEERSLEKQHLIAQNYTNFKAPIPYVNPHVDIINFHYAWPEAVEWNYHYRKVVGFDESGFAGSEDQVYRRQAWQFMLSGGGLYNNLDYSFFVGYENGRGQNKAPGGGSARLREQLSILSDFLHAFELEKLYPNPEAIISSPGLIPYIMSNDSENFALYLHLVGTEKVALDLSVQPGNYRVELLDPVNGNTRELGLLKASSDTLSIRFDIPEPEVALRIDRKI